jgi:hypothetical protein
MSIPKLTKNAEALHNQYTDKFTYSSDPNAEYLELLKKWETLDIPTFEAVVVKGQGIEAYLKSKEDYEVWSELQKYASAFLASPENKIVKDDSSPDDFLSRLIPRVNQGERDEFFKIFLRHEEEFQLEEKMDLMGITMTREKYIAQQADWRWESLVKNEKLPRLVQLDIAERFAAWRLITDAIYPEPKDLVSLNRNKQDAAKQRRIALAELLPSSQKRESAISRLKWEKLAKKKSLFSSVATFSRDIKLLVETNLVKKQADKKFRKTEKLEKIIENLI